MKLDSEEQRAQLLQLLGTVVVQIKMGDAGTIKDEVNSILDPIRNAEIERKRKR